MTTDPPTRTNDCGACNRCCKTTGVADAAARFFKPPGVRCGHARRGKGRAIYAARPRACAGYECFWLASQKGRGGGRGRLPGALRPDRCGAILEENGRGEMVVWMDAERPDAIERGALERFVDAEVDRGRVVVARVGDDDVRVIGHEEAALAFDARVRADGDALPHRLVFRPRRGRAGATEP
ncbi:hypothetical protein GCM10009416_14320 [Craurococcus roseus]|uniref:YkgJ family cysteine cluster protein n=1 Tax=Craurococcus roseus TaxID=77585 RepID=A0ABN1EX88_9PROT